MSKSPSVSGKRAARAGEFRPTVGEGSTCVSRSANPHPSRHHPQSPAGAPGDNGVPHSGHCCGVVIRNRRQALSNPGGQPSRHSYFSPEVRRNNRRLPSKAGAPTFCRASQTESRTRGLSACWPACFILALSERATLAPGLAILLPIRPRASKESRSAPLFSFASTGQFPYT